MLKRLVALLLAWCSFMPLSVCHAAESYYIEIGGNVNPNDADKQWQTLTTRFKKPLAHLTLYPKSIIEDGKIIATRLQAGPIADKNKAQHICAALFAKNTPCFVIEGAQSAPPTAVMTLSEKARETTLLPAPASPPPMLPWLVDKNTRGEVDVAEAIRVPLNDELVPATAPVTVTQLVAPAADHRMGWLNVDGFISENIAAAFWQNLRHTVPQKVAGMRQRLVSMPSNQTTLNLGPFPSENDALDFCHDTVLLLNNALSCRFDIHEPRDNPLLPGAHGPRRRFVVQTDRTATPPEKLYWVQVLSADSQLAALQAWNQLKTAQPDILQNRRSGVSASLDDKNRYVVRIGPLTSDDDAMALCVALKERGTDCHVLLYSKAAGPASGE